MKIIRNRAEGEIIEKKSRFIATMQPVQSQEEAEQFIAACKKKYWDARHNCSAYVIGENNEIMHSSDDGEPSGTAGRPMLSVLTGQQLHNVAVVVTRYFGGILLGTGGLVRAYQGAVNACIENCQIEEQIDLLELHIVVDYSDVGKIRHYMEQHKEYRTDDSQYGARVYFVIAVPVGEEDRAVREISQLTNGKAEIEKGKVKPSI